MGRAGSKIPKAQRKKTSPCISPKPVYNKTISQSRNPRVGRCPKVPDQRGVVAGRSNRKVRGAGSASHCCMMVCNGGCGVVPVPTKLPPPLCGKRTKEDFYVHCIRTNPVRPHPRLLAHRPAGTEQPRVLAFSGLVCAMAIVLESLPIYLMGPSLKIYFSFCRLAGMQLLRPGRGHDGRCHH